MGALTATAVSQVAALFESGKEVYRGYVDDPRNTDNAWMETTAMHFHCEQEMGEMLYLEVRGHCIVGGGGGPWVVAPHHVW